MKALAVITAVFLPASYIATLFSMSMFNWQGAEDSNAATTNGTSSAPASSHVVMPSIWIYWVVSVVLTLFIIVGWRVWWLNEDRKFQKRLPKPIQAG
jgi:hypothetical protein